MRMLNWQKIFPHPLKYAYHIGFLETTDLSLSVRDRYGRIHWVDDLAYRDEGWFADPFILKVNDLTIELLAEEMLYDKGRGVLVYLTIEKKSYKIVERTIVLELDTHLSFPIYVRENDKLYVYPENSQSGEVIIYEYDEDLKRLINPRTIIRAPLLDTQIAKIEDAYYAFGVEYRTGLQSDTKELMVYKSEELLGNYVFFQKKVNSYCMERGAGLIYPENDYYVRPVQNCEGGYGREVVLNKLYLKDGVFDEEEYDRIVPDRCKKNGDILHTFNKMQELVVIDGMSYYCPWFAKIYKKIRGIKD